MFNANSAIFQLYHGEKKLIFNEMMVVRSALYKTKTVNWIFIVLAHWNISPWINILLHSDTLSWFRAKKSLLFLFIAAWLAEKHTNTNFIVFGWTWSGLEPMLTITPPMNPWSTAPEASMLTITPPMRSNSWVLYRKFLRAQQISDGPSILTLILR